MRDFLHIDDFCDLVLDQIANFDAYSGRHWNVGGGVKNSVSLREATELCREITGRSVPVASTDENRPVRFAILHHRLPCGASAVLGLVLHQRDARRTIADIAGWIDGEGAAGCARCSWDSGTP